MGAAAVTQLRERKNMHMRLQGGAMYGYDLVDPERCDKIVGTKMVHVNKRTRPWTETTTYVLLDASPMPEFKTAADFLAAYEAKLKEQRS